MVEEVDDVEDSIYAGSSMIEYKMKTKRKKTVLDYGLSWTTYEVFNKILKKQVDALINLGVSNELKLVVLHLWTRYLENLGVAKMNEDPSNNKMKFNTYLRQCDQLHFLNNGNTNQRNVRQKMIQRINQKRKTQQRMAKNRLKMFGLRLPKKKHITDGFVSFLQSEGRTTDNESSFGNLSDDTESSLGTDSSCTTSEERKGSATSCSARRIYSKSGWQMKRLTRAQRMRDVRYMKLSRTLSFLYLALLLLRSDILLSDLIRLTWNGQVPFRDAAINCIPERMRFHMTDNSSFRVHGVHYHSDAREWTHRLAEYLGVTKLPEKSRKLEDIAARLLIDLGLPDCLHPYIESLMSAFPTRLNCEKGKLKHLMTIPNYEGRAAGYIIIVLKLLFGLDGETEWKLSEFCKQLKTQNLLHLFGEDPQLKWSSWMKHTMAKQSVVSSTCCRSVRDNSGYCLLQSCGAGNFYRSEGHKWRGKHSITHSASYPSEKAAVYEAILHPFRSLSDWRTVATEQDLPMLQPTSFPFISEFKESADRLGSCYGLRQKLRAKSFKLASVNYIVHSVGYNSGSMDDIGGEDLRKLKLLLLHYSQYFDLTRVYSAVQCSRNEFPGAPFNLQRHLSHSMYWLMCLFAEMLEMTPYSLYREVVVVEKEIHKLGRKIPDMFGIHLNSV